MEEVVGSIPTRSTNLLSHEIKGFRDFRAKIEVQIMGT